MLLTRRLQRQHGSSRQTRAAWRHGGDAAASRTCNMHAPRRRAGPSLDVPQSVTPQQLETLLNGLLQHEEKQPYSFYIDSQVTRACVRACMRARWLQHAQLTCSTSAARTHART